jgi:putative membrane protein
MARGARETLLAEILRVVNDAEIMTTDSHVVNTITGKNPVGMNVPVLEFTPFVMQALNAALENLTPAEAAASTAQCDRVVVFGSNRISELASTVNAMLVIVAPLSLAMLVLAFLLSVIAYIVMA